MGFVCLAKQMVIGCDLVQQDSGGGMDFEMVEDLRGRLEAGSLAFYMFCKVQDVFFVSRAVSSCYGFDSSPCL